LVQELSQDHPKHNAVERDVVETSRRRCALHGGQRRAE